SCPRFTTGRSDGTDSRYVWGILAGSAVGLLASTLGRLYSSAYYALRDTRTPLRFAIVRVILTTVLGYLCAIPLPRLLGVDMWWGAAGLTASAGVAGGAHLEAGAPRPRRAVRRGLVGVGSGRRSGRLGDQARAAAAASDRRGRVDSRSVRRGLPRRNDRAERARGARRPATCAAAFT